MAIPKVFISSTCYDLKQIRTDLKSFVESLGYQAVLSEKNAVAYNVTDTLEDDCYSEIDTCDIVVGIIGGNFGSESLDGSGNSVSMREMKKGIAQRKQMYIFVEQSVYAEYFTYEKNTDSDIVWAHVNNPKIFEFIGELRKHNNIIINEFSLAQDIVECLRSQWAGLFQSYLSNREKNRQSEGVIKINEASERLENCADLFNEYITNMIKQQELLVGVNAYGQYFVNPVIVEFSKELLGKDATMMLCKTKSEMVKIIKALGYEPFIDFTSGYDVYSNNTGYFYVSDFIFDDDGKIKKLSVAEISKYTAENKKGLFYTEKKSLTDDDDDLPF